MSAAPEFTSPFQNKSSQIKTLSSEQYAPSRDNPNSLSPAPTFHRRLSHASVLSELSDLDYLPNGHTDGLLRRTVSNISTYSTYSSTGPVTWRQRLRDVYYQNWGALLVLLSQIFGTAMNITTRLLEQPGSHGEPMHPFQILFTRQSLTALLCTIYALTTKSIPHFPLGPPDRRVRLLLVCRGLFGFFGVFGMYFSLLYLPLSEATVLTFLAPILTCYLCSLCLPNESFTRQQQVAGLVSFIGVIFIAQPVTFFSSGTHGSEGSVTPNNSTTTAEGPMADHDPNHPTPSQHMLAIAIAMLGVCGATGAMTSIRAIGTRAHAFISVNYFSVWSSIVSLLALIIFPDVSFRLPGNFTEWGLLLSLGVCGFIMQALLTIGLSYGGPAAPAPDPNTGSNLARSSKVTADDIEMHPRPLNSSTPSSSSSPPTNPPHHSRSNPRAKPKSKSKPKPKPHPSGNRATAMVYCQMLFALAADKVIFGTTLGIWSWIGSGLILSGAIWVAAAKDKPSKSKSKSKQQSLVDDEHMRTRHDSVIDGEGLLATGSATQRARNGSSAVRTDGFRSGEEMPEEQVGLLDDDSHDHDDNNNDNERDQHRPRSGTRPGISSSSSSSTSASASSSSLSSSILSPKSKPIRL